MTFNTHVCIIISSIPSNTIDYVRINEKKKTMRFNTSLLHAGVTKETNLIEKEKIGQEEFDRLFTGAEEKSAATE